MDIESFFEKISGGNLVFIGGRPGSGKTSIALKFAEFAAKKKLKMLFFSNEWPAEEISGKIDHDTVSLKSTDNLKELIQEIQRTDGIQYVILDYFQLLHRSENIESEMSDLKKMAEEKDVAVILMYAFDRRFNSKQGGILQFQIYGFSLEPLADIVGYVQVMADKSREILVVKHPHGKRDT